MCGEFFHSGVDHPADKKQRPVPLKGGRRAWEVNLAYPRLDGHLGLLCLDSSPWACDHLSQLQVTMQATPRTTNTSTSSRIGIVSGDFDDRRIRIRLAGNAVARTKSRQFSRAAEVPTLLLVRPPVGKRVRDGVPSMSRGRHTHMTR